jgi:hypothetical protein
LNSWRSPSRILFLGSILFFAATAAAAQQNLATGWADRASANANGESPRAIHVQTECGLPSPYAAQIVVDNNILIANGGRGFDVFNNSAGSAHAAIYARHNTLWGNNADFNETNNLCGEITINFALNVQVLFNMAATNPAYGCGGYPLYAYYVAYGNSTDLAISNLGWSASGTYSATLNSQGFSYASNNLFGANPSFRNASVPSAPNCMAAMIANFTPTNATAAPYGYQIPGAVQTYDPLFPQWLCTANLPAGLVTMGCLAPSSLPASVTITGVKAQ